MKNPPHPKERRGHRRIMVSFPANVRLNQSEGPYPALTIDASESGLLVRTLKDMPLETTLNIELLFPKESNLSHFKAVAKIVWKDICNWEDLEGYQYGLKLIQISNEDDSMLKKLLADPSFTKEARFVDHSEYEATLVLRVER